MANKNYGNHKFIIDQLRKDKIIYAVEAIATNILALLVFLFSQRYLEVEMQTVVSWIAVLTALGYTTFMGIGNFMRLRRIKKLEKEAELDMTIIGERK